MKTLKQFMKEEVQPTALTNRGVIDIQKDDVRDNINALLNGVTEKSSPTPYTALEHVKKVLANFHIFLPKTPFMDGESGYEVWNVSQFGNKVGMDNDGKFKSLDSSEYFLFFEYQMNDNGSFNIFSEIVDKEDLDDIISDIGSEIEKINEEKDYEGDMAKSELLAIADLATKLAKTMKDDDQLEAWVQSKITKAKDYIRAVHDNKMYNPPHHGQELDEMDWKGRRRSKNVNDIRNYERDTNTTRSRLLDKDSISKRAISGGKIPSTVKQRFDPIGDYFKKQND